MTDYKDVYNNLDANRNTVASNINTITQNQQQAQSILDQNRRNLVVAFRNKDRQSIMNIQKQNSDAQAVITSAPTDIKTQQQYLADIEKNRSEIQNYEKQGYAVSEENDQYAFSKTTTTEVPSSTNFSEIYPLGNASGSAATPQARMQIINNIVTNRNIKSSDKVNLLNQLRIQRSADVNNVKIAFSKLPDVDQQQIKDLNLYNDFASAYNSGDVKQMQSFQDKYNSEYQKTRERYYKQTYEKNLKEWLNTPVEQKLGNYAWAGITHPLDVYTKWGMTDKDIFDKYIWTEQQKQFYEQAKNRDILGYVGTLMSGTYTFTTPIIGKGLGVLTKSYPIIGKTVGIGLGAYGVGSTAQDVATLAKEKNYNAIGNLAFTNILTLGKGAESYNKGLKSEYRLPFSDYESRIKVPSKLFETTRSAYNTMKPEGFKTPDVVSKAVSYAKTGYKRFAGLEKKMGTATLIEEGKPSLSYLETEEASPLKTSYLKYKTEELYRVSPKKEWVPESAYKQWIKAYQKEGLSKMRYTYEPYIEEGKRVTINDRYVARAGSREMNLKLQLKKTPRDWFIEQRINEIKAMSPKIGEIEIKGPQLKTDVKYYKDLGILTKEGYYGSDRFKIRVPSTREITFGIKDGILPGIEPKPRSTLLKIEAYKPKIRPIRLESGARVVPKSIVKRTFEFNVREGPVTSAFGGLRQEFAPLEHVFGESSAKFVEPEIISQTTRRIVPSKVYVPLPERGTIGGFTTFGLQGKKSRTSSSRLNFSSDVLGYQESRLPDYIFKQTPINKTERITVNIPKHLQVPEEVRVNIPGYATRVKQKQQQKQEFERVQRYQTKQITVSKNTITPKPRKILYIPKPYSSVIKEPIKKKYELKITGGYRQRKYNIGSLLITPNGVSKTRSFNKQISILPKKLNRRME